jgi:glycosyltransferase involved in cell wall biosynthesis
MNEVSNCKPFVSVIVIANDKSSLKQTISSVISQTYPFIECIVVGDSLTSADSAFLADNKIANVKLITDSGESVMALFKEAVRQAIGNYVLKLESGSALCSKDSIESLLALNDKDYGVIYGDIKRLYSDGREDIVICPSIISNSEPTSDLDNILFSALIKKYLLDKYDFFDLDISYVHDWAFVIKAFVLGGENYLHQSTIVTSIPVSRGGTWYKLSNGHLIAIERNRLLKKYFPYSIDTNVLSESRTIGIDKVYSNLKYFLRSLRSKIDLVKYKAKYHNKCLSIPIIINNKNHVSYLKRLIASLEKRGYNNIHIIDNNSDYPQLLDFYNTTKYNVFRLPINVGFCALWDTDIFDLFKDQYYVYTDSDLEIIEECPDDFMVVMHYLLNKYSLDKVGFSLLTNDLPNHFKNKSEVESWESQFQKEKIERLAFQAPIDSTFALYKPNCFGYAGMLSSFRTSYPYSARHLPWYENSSSLTQEQAYYYKNAKTSSHWSKKVSIE